MLSKLGMSYCTIIVSYFRHISFKYNHAVDKYFLSRKPTTILMVRENEGKKH